MKLKTTTIAACLGIAVAATLATVAVSASATVRRLTPTGYCQYSGTAGDNYEASVLGYIIARNSVYISCGIPNDSLLPTSTIEKINVHIRTSSSSSYAQPCVYQYNNPSTFECDNYKTAGGTGERTISFVENNGDLTEFTSHVSWGSAVYVRLLNNNDLLNLVYVTD